MSIKLFRTLNNSNTSIKPIIYQCCSPRGHGLGLEAPRGPEKRSRAWSWSSAESLDLGLGLSTKVLGLGLGLE